MAGANVLAPEAKRQARRLLHAAGRRNGRLRQLYRGSRHGLLRVDAGGHDLIVRLAPQPPRPAAALAREALVLERVSAAGLAPEVEYFDRQDGGMVYRRVAGEPWRAAMLETPACVDELAGALDRLHGIELPLPALDLETAIAGYRDAIETRWPDDRAMRDRLDALTAEARALAPVLSDGRLAHNDLVVENIIGYPRPKFIDWEYAARFDRRFDLATLTALGPMSASARERLLGACGIADDARALMPRIESLVLELAWAWAMAGRAEASREHDAPEDGAGDRFSAWLERLAMPAQRGR